MRPRRIRPVVVIGDSLLDVDVVGSADRLSPDAPVPVLDVTGERARPGGAGLAAALLAGPATPVGWSRRWSPTRTGSGCAACWSPPSTLLTGPAVGGTAVKTRLAPAGRSLLRADRGAGRPGTGFGATAPGPGRGAGRRRGGAGVRLRPRCRRGPAGTRRVARAWPAGCRWCGTRTRAAPEPVPGITVVTPNLAEAAAARRRGPDPAGTVPRGAGRSPAGCSTAGRAGRPR